MDRITNNDRSAARMGFRQRASTRHSVTTGLRPYEGRRRHDDESIPHLSRSIPRIILSLKPYQSDVTNHPQGTLDHTSESCDIFSRPSVLRNFLLLYP